MKPSSILAIPAFAFCLLTGLSDSTHAAEAVVSNLEGDGIAACVIADAHGVPLAVGCHVRLVVFPDKTAAEIDTLASSGLTGVLDQSQVFGNPSAIGAGGVEPGRLEFQTGQALSQSLEGLHLLVTNAVDPAAASEFLLLRLPSTLPADELTGPGAHTSVHLADAEVVFGSETATGYATAAAAVPSVYENWVNTLLGGGYSDDDRLPDADPDRDGRVNLLEYATGSLPADAAQVECLKLQREAGGETQVLYLRRTGDEGILTRIDYRQALGEGDWSELTSAITTPVEVPFPAPDGCEWARQALPAGDRGFVRLRVELVP